MGAHRLYSGGNRFHGSTKGYYSEAISMMSQVLLFQYLHLPGGLLFLLNKTGHVVSDQIFCVQGQGHPPTEASETHCSQKAQLSRWCAKYAHRSTWLCLDRICGTAIRRPYVETYLRAVIQRKTIIFHSRHQDFLNFFLPRRYPASSCLAGMSVPILPSPASRKTSFSALNSALKNLAGVCFTVIK